MSKKKFSITLIGILSVLLVGAIIWLGWSGSTKDIVAVADQFKPDSTWELKEDKVTPPRHFCIDVRCPSIGRTWTMSKIVSQDELAGLVKKAGWSSVKADYNCLSRVKKSEPSYTCSLDGKVKGYLVSVYVDDDDPVFNVPSLTLIIE